MKKFEKISWDLFSLYAIEPSETHQYIGGETESTIDSGKGSFTSDNACGQTTTVWNTDDSTSGEKQCWSRSGCDAGMVITHYGNPFGNPHNVESAYAFGINISDPPSILNTSIMKQSNNQQ